MIAVIRIIGDSLSPPEKRKCGRYNEVFLSFWFCFLWFFFSSFYISQHETKKKSEIGFVKFPLEHNYHFKVLMTSNLVDKLSSILVFTKLYFPSVTFNMVTSKFVKKGSALRLAHTAVDPHSFHHISIVTKPPAE